MKRFFVFVLTFSMLMLITGCGGAPSTVSSSQDTSTVETESSLPGVASSEISVSSQPTESSKPAESSKPTASSKPTNSSQNSGSNQSSKPQEEKKNVLKIGTYNIANGSKVSHNMGLIAADITGKDLDIVGLQEVDFNSARSQKLDTMKVLSQLTGYKYYAFFKAIDLPESIGGEYGVGILSKYPIKSTNYWPMESFGREQRIISYAEIDVNGKTVNFFNTHFSYDQESYRTSQFAEVESRIKGKKNVILTGDFNIENIAEFNNPTSLNTVNNEKNPLSTWIPDDEWPTKCIDNIMYSSQFECLSSAVHTAVHSDHYMLYAELKIK